MEWKKPSQELIKLLVSSMGSFEAVKKTMFGSTVYFANGCMFIGVHEDHIFIRLPEDGRIELLSTFPGSAQFEPIKGRPMREYVVASPELYQDPVMFKRWIQRSLNYVKTIPPKAAKAKKK